MSTEINTSPSVKTYTLEEFRSLPAPPDGSKLELIAGVLHLSPPPKDTRDAIVLHLVHAIIPHLEAEGVKGNLYASSAAIWTSTRTYLEPDLFYVSAELEATLDRSYRERADLVVEIISPGSAMYARNKKADTYGSLGVGELWLIDETAKTVEVRRQTGGGFGEGRVFSSGEQVESTIFPALKLSVEQLFTA